MDVRIIRGGARANRQKPRSLEQNEGNICWWGRATKTTNTTTTNSNQKTLKAKMEVTIKGKTQKVSMETTDTRKMTSTNLHTGSKKASANEL